MWNDGCDYLKRETIRHIYTHESTYHSPSKRHCLRRRLRVQLIMTSVYAYLVTVTVALPSIAVVRPFFNRVHQLTFRFQYCSIERSNQSVLSPSLSSIASTAADLPWQTLASRAPVPPVPQFPNLLPSHSSGHHLSGDVNHSIKRETLQEGPGWHREGTRRPYQGGAGLPEAVGESAAQTEPSLHPPYLLLEWLYQSVGAATS